MSRISRLPLIALVAALAAPLGATPGSVQDFQLPPAPTPSPAPNVQGPVDTEGAVPVRPRAIPTEPAPAPTPAPAASPTPTPRPSATPTPTTRSAPSATPPQQPVPTRAAPPPVADAAEPVPQPEQVIQGPPELPQPPDGLAAQPDSQDPATGTAASEGNNWLPWLGALAALLLLAGGIFVFLRRRTASPAPNIEPPLVRKTVPSPPAEAAPQVMREPAPTPVTPPPVAPVVPDVVGADGTLAFAVEALKLTRSVMAVRVAYRLRVTNGLPRALDQVELCGDLVAARNGLPVSQQVASATTALDRRHLIERIEPGETQQFKGELVLELAGIEPIFQGRTPLLVPLMRWILRRESGPTLVETHVVGISPEPPATRLQPFRLDTPLQGFENIGNRPVA